MLMFRHVIKPSYKKYLLPFFFNESASVRKMGSLNESFESALKKLKTLKEEPENDVKLNLYSLFKQSTDGPCKTPKPSAFDFVGKAKWDAWNSLGAMSQEDAKQKYISLVEKLSGASSGTDSGEVKPDILYDVKGNVTTITYNRPAKKNAITTQMYRDIVSHLKNASENSTAITLITGEGDYFSSGNDLSNFTTIEGDRADAAKDAGELLKGFVAAFIDFPNVLVAAVNGPAVGIPVTLLGLFDIVYASDKATFQTPFSLLGQSPEGCSSYTFPKIMGYAKANEILMFNKKLTALEAKNTGLVTEVFPNDIFKAEVQKRLDALVDASKNSLIYSKELSRGPEKDVLHKVNAAECDRLVERWQSPDCMEALMKFFQRKGKL